MQQPSCSTCGWLLHFEHGFDAHPRMVRLPSRIRSSTFTFLRFQLVVNIVDILPPVYTSRTYAKAYIPITINVVNITTAPFLVIYPPAACSCKQGTCIQDREVGFPTTSEPRRCRDPARVHRKGMLRCFSSQHTPFRWSQHPIQTAGVLNFFGVQNLSE